MNSEVIPDITLQLVEGRVEKREERFTDNTIILPKSETAHIVLSALDEKLFSTLQEMADTLTVY